MFGKKETVISQNTEARTIIGEGVTINGDGMFGSGDVKIAGVFFNDVEIDGLLIIQDTGTVKGSVKASNVVVEGFVEGNIVSANIIHITATGRVIGDLKCMTLTIDEGASFSGLCEMGDRIKSNGVTYKQDQKNGNVEWNTDADITFGEEKKEEDK